MKTLALACLVLVLLCPSAPAAVPLGGLAVAVTPDGARLVAGGDSRALYVLDPTTLAVTQRVHLGRSIVALAFSGDGKRLWVESTGAVQMLDAASWKVLNTFEKAERMAVAPRANLVAVLERRGARIRLLSMADGSDKGAVPFDRMKSVSAFGLSPDGKQLAMLYRQERSDAEKKVERKDIPKDLKGAALNEFKQRNDGYQSRFVVHDVATGKAVRDQQLWYSASGGGMRIAWQGDAVVAIGYRNQNARIAADAEVTYFELANSYNYGTGVSADGSTVLSGGLRSGARTTLADRKGTAFELDKQPGFPEYWKSFSFANDGTGFGGTSGWRVVRIDAAGKIVKTAPVH